MEKKNALGLVALTMLALLIASVAFMGFIPRVHALQSSMVALVPGPNGEAFNGGSLPTNPPGGWPNGDTFTFVNVDPNQIATNPTDPLVAGGFDTVVLVQLSTSYWNTYSTFANRITNFVANGGKLIIYDSEITTQDYSTFIYPFSVSAPGAWGSMSGLLWIVENNALGSNSTAIPPNPSYSYVNTTMIGTECEIGDANVMVTYNSAWKTHMVATNLYGVTGPVHTYAQYDNGLIIWNGLDMDGYLDSPGFSAINNTCGSNAMGTMWYLELKQGVNPISPPLGGTVSTAGLALTPGNATNVVGTMHTVTAYVTNNLAQPIAGVAVNFSITSGPNMGLSGTGTTNSSGRTTFSWTSSVAGTDTVTAWAKPYTAVINATATKVWTSLPTSVIPEAPLGTIGITIALIAGFGLFATKNRLPKGLKFLRHYSH